MKQTVNGKIAKGHGYYLQHAKELCLVGFRGDPEAMAMRIRNSKRPSFQESEHEVSVKFSDSGSVMRFNVESDVLFTYRRGQSQKPEEIYEIAEALVPNGYYLEIFARRNNLHNGWTAIGNEI